MASNTLRVVALLKAQPDKVDELRDVLVGLVAPTREEAGCISYEMLENREDPTQFTFVEEWEDESALEAHFATDHILHALGEFPNLLAAELDVRRYSLVA